jgi:hypothetical protein
MTNIVDTAAEGIRKKGPQGWQLISSLLSTLYHNYKYFFFVFDIDNQSIKGIIDFRQNAKQFHSWAIFPFSNGFSLMGFYS